jgi:hypothetical protein
MDTHHHVVEWALANAIDPEKFNKIIWCPQDLFTSDFATNARDELKKATSTPDE